MFTGRLECGQHVCRSLAVLSRAAVPVGAPEQVSRFEELPERLSRVIIGNRLMVSGIANIQLRIRTANDVEYFSSLIIQAIQPPAFKATEYEVSK